MINFGQLSRRFIPPTPRRPDYSRFSNIYTPNEMDNNFNDPEQPLPIRPFPTQVPQQQQPKPQPQPQQDPYNFIDEYSKLNSNRPNRLAYRQAVEQGPEQIKRSGWARLGTALTSGAAALGGESVSDAAALGINAYNAPQVRANQRYKERVEGLGNLANMEDSDMQEKLKVLEMQNKDWYAQRENTRQDKQEERAGELSKAQIDNYRDEMLQRGAEEIIDPNTGFKIKMYKDGTIKQLGKVALTPKEKAEAAGLEAGARANAESPADMKKLEFQRGTQAQSDAAHAASALAVAQEGTQRAKDIQSEKSKAAALAAAARIREKAAQLKPNDQVGNMLNRLAGEVANGQLPSDAAQYLKFDDNGVAYADKGWGGDKETEDAVKDFIARQLGGGGNTNTAPAGSKFNPSGTTSTGRRYNVTPMPSNMRPSASHRGGR